MSKDEYEGYYCLLIAILCNVDAAEAQKMYKYGPDHPLCQKILKKKVRLSEDEPIDREHTGHLMKELIRRGYSLNAVADAFGCYPSTVRRRVRKAEEEDRKKKAS